MLGGCASAGWSRAETGAQATARDAEILVRASGRTHYFENRRPHCLAYVLDGEWEFAGQQAALRSTDRRRFVGVVLQSAEAIAGPSGGDLVSRAIAQIVADTEQEWGGAVQATVASFPASRAGAVGLEFDDVTIPPALAARTGGPGRGEVGKTVRLPLRVVAPFDAGLVVVVTALDATDARAIFNTLEVTEDPQCWRRAIRQRFPGVLR